MDILIRKENNNSIYIDKKNACYYETLNMSQPPYNFSLITIDNNYSDCINTDFNEDLTFSVEKYNARKAIENEKLYVDNIVAKIRLRYSINDELAILRQATTKPEEFAEYNAYVEQCKAEVKDAVS